MVYGCCSLEAFAQAEASRLRAALPAAAVTIRTLMTRPMRIVYDADPRGGESVYHG